MVKFILLLACGAMFPIEEVPVDDEVRDKGYRLWPELPKFVEDNPVVTLLLKELVEAHHVNGATREGVIEHAKDICRLLKKVEASWTDYGPLVANIPFNYEDVLNTRDAFSLVLGFSAQVLDQAKKDGIDLNDLDALVIGDAKPMKQIKAAITFLDNLEIADDERDTLVDLCPEARQLLHRIHAQNLLDRVAHRRVHKMSPETAAFLAMMLG